MSQLLFPLEEIDDGSGTVMQGHLAGCRCSNIDPEYDEGQLQNAFYCFWDHRFQPPHLHIQCYDCEQTYCPFQQCVPPPTAEVIQRG